MHTGPCVSNWVWFDMIEVCTKCLRKPEKWCQPGKEGLPAVPAALRSRTQSLFHGNPPALEFTSFPDMEPLEVLISSPNDVSRSCNGHECLTGGGGRNRTDWERQEVKVLCVRQDCLLPDPKPTEQQNRDSLQPRPRGHQWPLPGRTGTHPEKGDTAGRALSRIGGPLTSYPTLWARAFSTSISSTWNWLFNCVYFLTTQHEVNPFLAWVQWPQSEG